MQRLRKENKWVQRASGYSIELCWTVAHHEARRGNRLRHRVPIRVAMADVVKKVLDTPPERTFRWWKILIILALSALLIWLCKPNIAY